MMKRLVFRLWRAMANFGAESARASQLVALRASLARANARLEDVELELGRARSEVERIGELLKIRNLTIEQLSDVIVRDRKRVEAEIAIEARKIAAATQHVSE